MWIKIEDELPIQGFPVEVKNGKRIFYGWYYRKKWRSWDIRLHKVTEWYKCPISYPKIPPKDWRAFRKRSVTYRQQMQPRNFTYGPIIGLHTDIIHNFQSSESFLKEMKNGMD